MTDKTMLVVRIGTCQNAFWDNAGGRMENFRYCDQPAMDIPGVRNLCAQCGARAETFRDRLDGDTVETFGVEGAARWLAGSYARYIDQCGWAYQVAAERRPLAEVRKAQAWADTTAHLINLMVGRWANEIRAAIRRGQIDPAALALRAQDLELAA